MATKHDQLRRLQERMEEDSSLPLRAGATHLVFGEGSPDAVLYLLGEAPGQAEDAQGRPFVGQAGRLLTRLLERSGIRREDVYISNLVRFRPPQNRPLTSAEIAAFGLPWRKTSKRSQLFLENFYVRKTAGTHERRDDLLLQKAMHVIPGLL